MAKRNLPLYDLDKPVGPKKPNLDQDVQLIRQLLIKLQQGGDPLTEGMPPVAASGGFDAALGAAILHYQQKGVKRGFRMFPDGIIHPLPSKSGGVGDADATFATGVFSTLFAMDVRLFRINRAVYLALGDQLNLPWTPDPFK
jgi:hypothetical protein